MPYKKVGFFFELDPTEQRKELDQLRRPMGVPDEARIINYLSSGTDVGVEMTMEHDLLCDPARALGPAVLKSDGDWLWPASLAHYVRSYHIELPAEFVRHMARNEWRTPETGSPTIPEGHVQM